MKKVKNVVCRRVSPSGDENEKFNVSVDDEETRGYREGKLLDKVTCNASSLFFRVYGEILIKFALPDAESDCPRWIRGSRGRSGGYGV